MNNTVFFPNTAKGLAGFVDAILSEGSPSAHANFSLTESGALFETVLQEGEAYFYEVALCQAGKNTMQRLAVALGYPAIDAEAEKPGAVIAVNPEMEVLF